MGFLANLLVKIGVDNTDLNGGMDKATRSVNKFATDVESAGKRLTLGLTLPIAGLGLAAIKTAGEMEQTRVGFTTLMKSADEAGKHIEQLKQFALVTPFQFQDLTKASRLMQAYGFAAQDVVPKLRTIGNAVSALGGGSDLLERVVRSVGEIGTRGKITGEQLRELSRAGIPALDAIAKKLGVSVAEAQKQITAGTVDAKTAMDALLEYMDSRFKGGMEAQSKTVLGSWSNIKDKITFTLAELGTALLPIAKNAMGALDPILGTVKDLAAGFAALPKPVQDAALGLGGLAIVAPLLTVAFGATITNAIAIGGAVSKVIPLIGKLAAGFELWVAGMGQASISWGTMVATGMLRVGLYAGLAVAVAKLAEAWWQVNTAQKAASDAGAEQTRTLLILETSLKQRGADITAIQKQYSQGQITLTQYLQELAKVGKQLGANISTEQKHATVIVDIDKMLTDAGMKTMAQRKKDLEDAKALYAAVAREYGSGSEIALEALERVNQATAALVPKLKEVKQGVEGLFKFGDRGVESAVLVEQIRQHESELQKWIQAVAKAGSLEKYHAQTLLEMSNAMKLLDNPPAVDGMGKMTKTLNEMLTPVLQLPPDLKAISDALDLFGLTTDKNNIPKLTENFNILGKGLEDGTVDVDQYLRAWIKLMHAMDTAGVQLDPAAMTEVIQLEKDYGGQIKETRKEASKLEQEMTRTFHSISRGIASSIVNFKGWGDTFKTIAKDTAQSILTIFIEGMFKKLAKELADLLASAKGVLGKIGTWLGGIVSGGGGAASSAGSAAGGVSSGAAGAASGVASGVMGTIGAVGAAVGAVSSVIGNFQMAGMNKSLDVLVNHTLRIYNELANFRADAWTREGHWYARTSDMWQTLLDIKDTLGRGITATGGKGGVTFNNCTFSGTTPQAMMQAAFDAAYNAGAL